MTISPIFPVLTTPVANKTIADVQPEPKPTPPREIPKPAQFDPLPALHPTLQDKIDVNRTLLLLRQAV